ncbi:conserved hypothetical protein [Mucor ambiguus]|uniref:Integral membrane protein n=1 Tax=Mucor ambiguus TaxID=91626 RepID=A0A0C9M1Z9_9FUNG|nr:conserved hypothetical protein [Mucor ambiguus]
MASSSFRSSKWDPILIIAQIAALQSLCYVVYSIVLFIALTLNGSSASLDLIFNYKEIRTDTGFGWSLIIVWLVNACLSIPILMVIVQRARQILDYVLTFHFFHLLFVWYVSQRFPSSIAWWLLQLVNVIIMTFGGEWACMHREMKPIMITSGSKKSTSNSSQSKQPMQQQQQQQAVEEEEEEGLISQQRGSSSSKLKRKSSDAEPKEGQDLTDEGALLAAVGKAKKALMLSAGRSKRNGKQKYDQIPMKDMDSEDNNSISITKFHGFMAMQRGQGD